MLGIERYFVNLPTFTEVIHRLVAIVHNQRHHVDLHLKALTVLNALVEHDYKNAAELKKAKCNIVHTLNSRVVFTACCVLSTFHF